MDIDRYIEKELGIITHPSMNGPLLRLCAVSVVLHVLIAYTAVRDHLAKASAASMEEPVMIEVMDDMPHSGQAEPMQAAPAPVPAPVKAQVMKATPAPVPLMPGIADAAAAPRKVIIIGDSPITARRRVMQGATGPVPYQQRRGGGMVAQSVFSNISSR